LSHLALTIPADEGTSLPEDDAQSISHTLSSMTSRREISPARAAKLQRLLTSRSKKTKVSISVSADLVAAADELAGKSHRSELFERGIRSLMRRVVRRARHERELALLDKHAESLNAAAADSLEFQSDLQDE
jgi:hypothetical protein